MSKFSITIDTSNDAFTENESQEIVRILEQVSFEIREYGANPQNLRDYNGNIVGTVRYEYEGDE